MWWGKFVFYPSKTYLCRSNEVWAISLIQNDELAIKQFTSHRGKYLVTPPTNHIQWFLNFHSAFPGQVREYKEVCEKFLCSMRALVHSDIVLPCITGLVFAARWTMSDREWTISIFFYAWLKFICSRCTYTWLTGFISREVSVWAHFSQIWC